MSTLNVSFYQLFLTRLCLTKADEITPIIINCHCEGRVINKLMFTQGDQYKLN